jgi:hypothetical protein
MESKIVKQEILLVVKTVLKKEFCEKNNIQNNSHQSPAEQLEQACWNGLMDELLFGIVDKPALDERLCLWQIQHGQSVLEIELCNFPQYNEKNLSINPNIFLSLMSGN